MDTPSRSRSPVGPNACKAQSARGFPDIIEGRLASQALSVGVFPRWEAPQDPQPIWVIYTPNPEASQGDTWNQYEDLWQAGQPEYPPACPEASPPLGPKSGFGLTWCYQTEVKVQVGRSLKEEFGSADVFPKGAVQFFQGGIMFENPADRQIWVLIYDDGWYRFSY